MVVIVVVLEKSPPSSIPFTSHYKGLRIRILTLGRVGRNPRRTTRYFLSINLVYFHSSTEGTIQFCLDTTKVHLSVDIPTGRGLCSCKIPLYNVTTLSQLLPSDPPPSLPTRRKRKENDCLLFYQIKLVESEPCPSAQPFL